MTVRRDRRNISVWEPCCQRRVVYLIWRKVGIGRDVRCGFDGREWTGLVSKIGKMGKSTPNMSVREEAKEPSNEFELMSGECVRGWMEWSEDEYELGT